MSGDIIDLAGKRKASTADESLDTRAAARADLNNPRNWVEPFVPAQSVSNLIPRVTIAGGLATLTFAMIDHPLPLDEETKERPQGTVQAKIVMPAGLLQETAIALAQAAGARIVQRPEGAGDGKSE